MATKQLSPAIELKIASIRRLLRNYNGVDLFSQPVERTLKAAWSSKKCGLRARDALRSLRELQVAADHLDGAVREAASQLALVEMALGRRIRLT